MLGEARGGWQGVASKNLEKGLLASTTVILHSLILKGFVQHAFKMLNPFTQTRG